MIKLWIVALVGSSSIFPIPASPLAKNNIETRPVRPTHEALEQEQNLQEIVDEPNLPLAGTMKKTQLDFYGEFCHDHEFTIPPTVASPRPLFSSFFQDTRHRNLLLKGGGNPTRDIPQTPEILAEWTTQSRHVSSTPPIPLQAFNNEDEYSGYHQDHAVVAIHSTVPLVPGLSIQAISYTGCRLLPNPHTNLPMYEFTLIQDRYQAQGTKPLVWIYRKITGEAPAATGNDSPTSATTDIHGNRHPLVEATSSFTGGSRTTKGLCRVALEHAGGETWRLSYYSMVKVSCTLPQKLLKLLPLSKQKVEAKISETMVKQLERETLQSASKFQSALEAWMNRQIQ